MEFRLLYRGQLVADAGQKQKHRIRTQMHRQLKRLWEVHPALRALAVNGIRPLGEADKSGVRMETPLAYRLTDFANNYFKVGQFRFVPLVTNCLALSCGLGIVWMRREDPTKIIQQHGDLDRRLITLFDALRMPKPGTEIAGLSPSRGEDPFFCLLEDDSLITDIQVTADHLLTPPPPSHPDTDTCIVIRVRVKLVRATESNLGFA